MNTCIAEAPTDNSEFTITLGADFNITTQKDIVAGKNITITSTNPSAPAILTRDPGFAGRLFSINIAAPSVVTLTIDSVILDGNNQPATTGNQLVYTIGTGSTTLNIVGNTVLKNNNSTSSGGALFTSSTGGSFLTISDQVKITNNSALNGAGIYVSAPTTVTINGSVEITGNTASNSGAGVYITNSLASISGNVVINDNTADARGGGVFVTGTTAVTISGHVKIFGNTVTDSGGGIYVANPNTTLDVVGAVDIFNNTAAVDGGGIYVIYGTLTVNGGLVQGNTASNRGGGIYSTGGSIVTLSGTTSISGNTAARGGGIFNVNIDTILEINSGKIEGNTADYGGGIFNFRGEVTLGTIATISGNTAQYGAGIFNYDGGRVMLWGIISGNTANDNGGGIFNNTGGEVTLQSTGVVSSNTANDGAGIYNSNLDVGGHGVIGKTSIVTMQGGKITDNSASGLGNGIYFEDGSIILGSGAQVGPALGAGNGIYLNTSMIIGLQSGFTGFANLEGAADAYLGRPVAEGTSGYTASASDIARFKWLPADFALELNSATSQIVLGAVPGVPGTGENSGDEPSTAQIASGIVASMAVASLVALVKRKL